MAQAGNRISRKRRLAWTLGVIAAALLSWWAQLYDPLRERLDEQQAAMAKWRMENERLQHRIDRLSEYAEPPAALIQELQNRRSLFIPGRAVEEVNAGIQTVLQEVADRSGATLKSYKNLPSRSWKDHTLAQVEVQMETTTEHLAAFLEALGTLKKLVRVEKMTVSYRKTKGAELLVTIQAAALLLEDGPSTH